MSFRSRNPFLRLALLGDAAASGAAGLLMAAGAGPLAGPLGLPEELLRYAGLALLPYAALVARLGTRPDPARGAVWAVIAVNACWAADSLLLLLSGWVAPTALGTAFVLAQAAVVAAFAVAQHAGLRRGAQGMAVAHG
ncbi:MAG TPA: hypothetical protein VEH84_16125 [Alphaproteobacteria bacterium]|nr:hypothetical protein [Alphaproteobacteria bacterium]